MNTPPSINYLPDVDEFPEPKPLFTVHHHPLTDTLRYMVELWRKEITAKVLMMSLCSSLQEEDHLKLLFYML